MRDIERETAQPVKVKRWTFMDVSDQITLDCETESSYPRLTFDRQDEAFEVIITTEGIEALIEALSECLAQGEVED